MTRAAHILLVDDEASIQRAVAPLLRSRGYDVETVGTGVEALRSAGERPPDLVVLDLGLPDLDGTEVCRRIRKTSDVPIIVLSARGNEADKVAALDLGADDYVTKPFKVPKSCLPESVSPCGGCSLETSLKVVAFTSAIWRSISIAGG